jgi:hypothetical protein
VDKGLAALKIEHWYHVFVVLGAGGTIASLSFELKGVANAYVLIVSLGVLLIGIGEWINIFQIPTVSSRNPSTSNSDPSSDGFLGCPLMIPPPPRYAFGGTIAV